MNPHDDIPDDTKDEKPIASLLSATDADAAPPDADVLAKLRAQSTDAFSAVPSQATTTPERTRPMLTRAARWLGAAAAVVVIGFGLYSWLVPGPAGVAFGKVLENVEKADTLHIRITQGDKHTEFWHTSKTKQSRWDDLDGNYRIADGANFWIINENANEAKRANPPSKAGRSVDQLLDMLGLPADRATLLAALPVERIREGDVALLVYRAEIPNLRGTTHFEARVVAQTQRLLSMRIRFDVIGKPSPPTELTVLAYDEPIAAEKFDIGDTLTEDGRIGKVTDVQGIVTIKPVLHERWTPVRPNLVLKPGDWVRTDARGANATALRLVRQVGIILGPKTLVELVSPKQIRLLEGEIEVTASAGASVEVLGPGPDKFVVKDRKFFRIDAIWNPPPLHRPDPGRRDGPVLVQVEVEPSWLRGFKGATTNETLGSLVAKVDGRNVPLTVGYHKVTVDIRDQIARTVIEESFVNHTKTELEGIFYFPLPADASISGFGMWIGNNLVEADVVEKQRAREIYETILREKRDPGLLEWSGGNIFKARVYPIAANSEKRIKITYTQVLPLKGSRYRYSYALQSELLQQTPLRELSIDVKVNSVIPLKSVTSPTHPTRGELGSPRLGGGEGLGVRGVHSAHVEFSAHEYKPTRDFEVVVETEKRQADVVMIPHRRGEDGYFMLQLTPPGAAGDWDRPLLPNGDPLHLLILADTSASMDAGQRATQAAFIGSLLASLSPKDTFNLAACDVACVWAFAKAMSADAKSITPARDFLAKRSSLGWTNLDIAFASALTQVGANTHIIYVGDGIQTAGSGEFADPIAFAQRLRKLYQGKGTFHAVTLGSSYESAVLKAIASLGSGSMRKITSEQGPPLIARELLGEIAQPAMRDIKVEFKGFKAARVYPESLANIPAGAQQILMGRYLPDGKDQAGEVIVTGTQGGKLVRFSTNATFKDAEQGNSFIPRLWARMHLDSLLEQGASDTIKDEIIALSEDFQIITPYTSLLVLETDADRERFKVKRRFQMRDGERFFADGRDNTVFDLRQKQIKKAGDWRTALRRSVLREMAGLGRNPRMFQPTWRTVGSKLGYLNELVDNSDSMESQLGELDLGLVPLHDPLAAARPENLLRQMREEELDRHDFRFDDAKKGAWPADLMAERSGIEDQTVEGREHSWDATPFFRGLDPDGAVVNGETMLHGAFEPEAKFLANGQVDVLLADERQLMSPPLSRLFRNAGWSRGPSYGQWLNTLFPPLLATPGKAKEPKSTWPAEARDLVKSLLRNDRLAKMAGGIAITRQTERFDSRWGDLNARSRSLELVSAKSWLTRTGFDGSQTLVSWCDTDEIGVYSRAFQLGRVRTATLLDVQAPPLDLHDHSLSSLERAYPNYAPTLEPQGKDRTLLVLKYPPNLRYETRILIDTARHVILSIEERNKDKVTSTVRFDDFVEGAGSWWAGKIETIGPEGKRLQLVTQTVKTLTLKELEQQTKAELADRAQVQLIRLPLPSVKDAKKALASGKARFDDQFVLLLHFLRSQQWPRVLDHLQQAEKLAAGKPGVRWLHSALLYDSRRHDDLRQRYQQDAVRLAKDDVVDAYPLAEHIVNQSANVLQANEMLKLLDALQPLIDKQPPHVQARKRWQHQRASYLGRAGRTDEALLLQKKMAADYPRDYSVQQQYAQALADTGDYPAAYAWLTRVLVKESKWSDYEEQSLRNTYTSLLQQQGRYADLVKYVSEWTEQNPIGRSAYEQYLSALVKTDQIEKAEALALRWLKDAQMQGELAPAVEGRLEAAVNFMLGDAYNLSTSRIEDRWLLPLGEAVLFFARHETHYASAERILSRSQFQRSDEGRRVRKVLATILTNEIDKMPVAQVRRFIYWSNAEDIDAAGWAKIGAKLRERWMNETRDSMKDELGQVLVTLLSSHGGPNEPLTFLRLQLQKGPDKYRAPYANQLFDHLLAQEWTAEFETEALTLLDKLSSADEPGARLLASVTALHRLTDRLLESRIAAGTNALKNPEKLTRTDLLKKHEEFRKAAREGLADRLHKEAAKHPKAIGQWLVAESLYLDLLHDRNLKQAAAEAWAFVGVAPPKKNAEEPTIERALDDMLRQRYLVTLTNLAARKGADPALVDRLVKYLDQGIKADADADHWKAAKYRLLIALDRAKELEQSLKQWTRDEDPDNRWRVALGYLLAEQGKLPEAIREFEAIEAADELSPSAYRSLADWYLAQDEREKHERATAAIYKTTPEYRLTQMIASKLHPWQRGDAHLPSELDKEVLRMFAVQFERSATPQQYLHSLQQFYQASHDFRLLSGLPDAVIGHTAARVYPFVQGMDSVLGEVRDEATADEIVKRIAEVRPRAKTVVDQRALDLLEVLVERRAAEVQNQAGPHRDRALAALQRAFKRDWSPGEHRLMADFLANLGTIAQQPLADEQLRQLKAMHVEAKAGTLDRLHIAHRYAATMHRYNRAAAAIDLLEAALAEFESANDSVLPVTANDALTSFLVYLEGAGHFARGEKVLFAQLKHPVHAQQRLWLRQRLDQLYYHALASSGEVSLGKGLTLYQALSARLQKDLADTDQNHRYQVISLLCQVYRTAHEKKLPGVSADVKTFAFKVVPPLLNQQMNNHDNAVSNVARTVYALVAPREGINFLLTQIENEPRWLRFNNLDGWSRHGHTLTVWRKEVKDLGDAEGRLLKIVLTELRRDLEMGEHRNHTIYHQGDQKLYWKEKEADFVKTAEAVLAERNKSAAAVQYIAAYLYSGVGQPKRAIEILFVAHNQKLLDEAGQVTLIHYLHIQGRHGESIALLQPLVERRPENLDYRVMLMQAYFKTDRNAELLTLLKQTDAYFHEKGRWSEFPLERLAHSTLRNELFEQSIAYFKELIPLHERTHPNRGIGNGTLADYYMGLARAYAGLKRTPEAVDAAGAAIVAWGPRHNHRTQALETLKEVLLASPDLDAFVVHFDKQKQDSAVVRKAIGQAYSVKKEHAKAILQLTQAAELQPNDAEIYQLLVKAHDENADKAGAVRQLLQAVQLSRRDLKLYEDLGKRYTAAGQSAEAERAYTSIVEMQPGETESHALLAEIREKQNRWPEAIQHWEQVAKLRTLEPTGLVKLAAAQIHEKQWDQARETLRKLQTRTWPTRFSEVREETRKLEEQLAKQPKK